MPLPEFGPQESGPDERPLPATGGSQPEQAVDPALLENVLQQTLTMCRSDEPLDAGSRMALKEVAARHRGKPFSLEPVAVELVAAVLRTQGKGGSSTSEAWRAASSRVAQTLCEDPASRKRLEAFWNRLSEG